TGPWAKAPFVSSRPLLKLLLQVGDSLGGEFCRVSVSRPDVAYGRAPHRGATDKKVANSDAHGIRRLRDENAEDRIGFEDGLVLQRGQHGQTADALQGRQLPVL